MKKRRKPLILLGFPAEFLAFPRWFEHPTYRLGGGRSIQLSYGNIFKIYSILVLNLLNVNRLCPKGGRYNIFLGGVCSIQLSYWDIYFYRIILAVFWKNVKRQRQKSRDFSLPDAYNGRPERQKAEGREGHAMVGAGRRRCGWSYLRGRGIWDQRTLSARQTVKKPVKPKVTEGRKVWKTNY